MQRKEFYIAVVLIIFFLTLILIRILSLLSEQSLVKSPIGIPADKESCEARSGAWRPIGLSPEPRCNLPTSDSGKECSNSNECEGYCVIETPMENLTKIKTMGQCTEWRIVVGCMTLIKNGRAIHVCID